MQCSVIPPLKLFGRMANRIVHEGILAGSAYVRNGWKMDIQRLLGEPQHQLARFRSCSCVPGAHIGCAGRTPTATDRLLSGL
jgi:hypothetical protein